jgi:hypothetical protein
MEKDILQINFDYKKKQSIDTFILSKCKEFMKKPNNVKNNFLLFCKAIINAIINNRFESGGRAMHIGTIKILYNYFLDQELLSPNPTILKKSKVGTRK